MIQIGHSVQILDVLSHGFASSVETLWFHGNQINKISFLIHLLRLNTDLCPSLLKKLYGFLEW